MYSASSESRSFASANPCDGACSSVTGSSSSRSRPPLAEVPGAVGSCVRESMAISNCRVAICDRSQTPALQSQIGNRQSQMFRSPLPQNAQQHADAGGDEQG